MLASIIGNFVLIDHEDGAYSLLVHMKPGSVSTQ
jgi:murein DD-endopeptidase MepM/ murein hydrolase activator NlpD